MGAGPEEGSLYIRPCVFATDAALRVAPPAGCRFVIFTCAVGQCYSQPLRLLVSTDQVRAFPGGTGNVKPAGNYAPALLADAEARRRGFGGVLWLDAREHRFIEEAGVMNVFFVIDGTVVTPDLTDTILPGITRDSVIALLKSVAIPVEERPVSIDEIAAAHAAGRLQECFGAGTAATISRVTEINHQGRSLVLPAAGGRHIAHAVAARLAAIRTGREPDPFGWLIPV
ncbi:MAG TPA: aminotransferase class IV [Streptosporangiaceae bacterium]